MSAEAIYCYQRGYDWSDCGPFGPDGSATGPFPNFTTCDNSTIKGRCWYCDYNSYTCKQGSGWNMCKENYVFDCGYFSEYNTQGDCQAICVPA